MSVYSGYGASEYGMRFFQRTRFVRGLEPTQADALLLGENREAEFRFYAEDPMAVEVGYAIAQTEQELARLSDRLAQAGSLPAIEMHGLGRSSMRVTALSNSHSSISSYISETAS